MDKMAKKLNREMRVRWFSRNIRAAFGSLRKPTGIVWKMSYGGSAPHCPHCGELVYYEDRCCFCGQRFLPGAVTIGGMLDARAKAGAMEVRRKL